MEYSKNLASGYVISTSMSSPYNLKSAQFRDSKNRGRFGMVCTDGTSGSISVQGKMDLNENTIPCKQRAKSSDCLRAPLDGHRSRSVSNTPLSDITNTVEASFQFLGTQEPFSDNCKALDCSLLDESNDDKLYDSLVGSEFPVVVLNRCLPSIYWSGGPKSHEICGSGNNSPKKSPETGGIQSRGILSLEKNSTASHSLDDPSATDSGPKTREEHNLQKYVRASMKIVRMAETSDESSDIELIKQMREDPKYPVVVLNRLFPLKDNSYALKRSVCSCIQNSCSLPQGKVPLNPNENFVGGRTDVVDSGSIRRQHQVKLTMAESNCTSLLSDITNTAVVSFQGVSSTDSLGTPEPLSDTRKALDCSSLDESNDDELYDSLVGSTFPVVVLDRCLPSICRSSGPESHETCGSGNNSSNESPKTGGIQSQGIMSLLKNSTGSHILDGPCSTDSVSKTREEHSLQKYVQASMKIARLAETSDKSSDGELMKSMLEDPKYPVVVLNRLSLLKDNSYESKGPECSPIDNSCSLPQGKVPLNSNENLVGGQTDVVGSRSIRCQHQVKLNMAESNFTRQKNESIVRSKLSARSCKKSDRFESSKSKTAVNNISRLHRRRCQSRNIARHDVFATPCKNQNQTCKWYSDYKNHLPSSKLSRMRASSFSSSVISSSGSGSDSSAVESYVQSVEHPINIRMDWARLSRSQASATILHSEVTTPSIKKSRKRGMKRPLNKTVFSRSRSESSSYESYEGARVLADNRMATAEARSTSFQADRYLIKSTRATSAGVESRSNERSTDVVPSGSSVEGKLARNSKNPGSSCYVSSNARLITASNQKLDSVASSMKKPECITPKSARNGIIQTTKSLIQNENKTNSIRERDNSPARRFKMAMKHVWDEFGIIHGRPQPKKFKTPEVHSWRNWTQEQLSDFMKLQSSVSSLMPDYFSSNQNESLNLQTVLAAVSQP